MNILKSPQLTIALGLGLMIIGLAYSGPYQDPDLGTPSLYSAMEHSANSDVWNEQPTIKRTSTGFSDSLIQAMANQGGVKENGFAE